jgi:tryptophan halogenase
MNKVVIVGGGTSGWSAAAMLSKNQEINITIIEPSDISPIGVGESTLPHINGIHNRMGLDIFKSSKWLDKVNGTLKFSVTLKDFNTIGSTWLHPFLIFKDHEITKLACKSQTNFTNNNLSLSQFGSKKFIEGNELDAHPNLGKEDVGYQFDAIKYANLLKKECLKRPNLSLVDAHVTDIVVENENISKIILSNGNEIKADLFIDCTGFKALLSNAVNSEWDNSYKERLFTDTALVIQLPYLDKSKQRRNTTTCTALKNGWVWNVPLQERIGTGYVFSSRHTSEEDALEEFKEHLSSMYGYDKADIHPRTVPFKVGIRPESWKNNVVAIGLSSFFLEPIESTAIASTQHQINMLNYLLVDPILSLKNKIKHYNSLTKKITNHIASYIELHYILSKRRDSQFWKDVTNIKLTNVQKKILDHYIDPNKDFEEETAKESSIFNYDSFLFLFLGYGILPNNKEKNNV